MGLLNGTSVYLIGSVDHHKNPRGWRKEIADKLLHPLGVKVYDPLVKPSWFQEKYPIPDPSNDFEFLKTVMKSPNEFSESLKQAAENRMNGVRELCLRMTHDCNFIICSMPKKFTVGTMEELGVAAAAKKPILLYLPDGADTSTWLPAQLNKSCFYEFYDDSFATMNALYDRVRLIDSGDVDVNSLEWLFLSYFDNEDVKNEFSIH